MYLGKHISKSDYINKLFILPAFFSESFKVNVKSYVIIPIFKSIKSIKLKYFIRIEHLLKKRHMGIETELAILLL